MTETARRLLDDCRVALAEFEEATDDGVRRRRWITVVALLRAVGHVLVKVDRPRSDLSKRKAIDDGFKSRKSLPVFTEFIDAERNNVLKEYRFNPQENGPIANVYVQREVDETGDHQERRLVVNIEESVVLTQGHFATYEPRQVARLAIQFWSDYLDDIDRAAPPSGTNDHTRELAPNPPRSDQ